MTRLYLGKKPARPGSMTFAMSQYVDMAKLPPIPDSFGHDNLIGAKDWGAAGNLIAGDCVMAMQAHAVMLWNRMAGRSVVFNDQCVLSDYSALTGYDPSKTDANGDNATDQGTDMTEAAEYFRTTGMVDASGQRHRVMAYLSLNAGDLNELWAATYLFGAVGIGINLPTSAEDQFKRGAELTYVPGSPSLGGHAILGVAKRGNVIRVVTWGEDVPMSLYAFAECCDEAVAWVSEEALIGDISIDGFNRAALLADLQSLKGTA